MPDNWAVQMERERLICSFDFIAAFIFRLPEHADEPSALHPFCQGFGLKTLDTVFRLLLMAV